MPSTEASRTAVVQIFALQLFVFRILNIYGQALPNLPQGQKT